MSPPEAKVTMSRGVYQQVNLMLSLYDLRREKELRRARTWFLEQFRANSLEEISQNYREGDAQRNWIQMVVTYWDMVAGLVNGGLIADDLFFETNGELWVVWERIRHLVPAWRRQLENPQLLSNLEQTSRRLELWREGKAPGSTARLRDLLGK
jgi:hypothetical protein